MVLAEKVKLLCRKLFKLPFYILAIPALLIIRLIRPWLLVRLGGLVSSRIGHFIANTEIYLCNRDAGIFVPNQRYTDLFYMSKPICNQQVAIMWKRVLRIRPTWILEPIYRVNGLIPGGKSHDIGPNLQLGLDVNNLLDRFPPHLQFTAEEETCGEEGLRTMGLPVGAKFVCLIVRDSAYLDSQFANDWSYHNYRDSDIQNYVLAAEALAERGYFVIRMGAKVKTAINSTHPKVIDYAANDMRSEFMDIYLGAKCAFCISTGTGWDAVPEMLRRPIVYVNMVPIGNLHTFRAEFLSIAKRHVLHASRKTLTLSEIFSQGVGFCTRTSDYESADVDLYENTPEEIRDVVIEMAERLNGTWQAYPKDESLQQRFWEIFPADVLDAKGHLRHGEIRARFGAAFLRNNPEWLQ
jgi:putative glycosyltransferase (TIGR04372 family)